MKGHVITVTSLEYGGMTSVEDDEEKPFVPNDGYDF